MYEPSDDRPLIRPWDTLSGFVGAKEDRENGAIDQAMSFACRLLPVRR